MNCELLSKEKAMEIFGETLKVIEEKCIHGDMDFQKAIMTESYRNSDYVRNVFEFVAGISVGKYIRRRCLTEKFLHVKNYDLLKTRDTVGGISRFKEKMKREFGMPPFELQYALDLDRIESKLEEKYINKIHAGMKIRMEKGKQKIILDKGIIPLTRNGKVISTDWENICYVWDDISITLKAQKSIGRVEATGFVSILFEGNTYFSIMDDCAVNDVFRALFCYMMGGTVYGEDLGSVQLNTIDETGWGLYNLITSCESENNVITKVKCSEWLKIKDKNLYLDLREIEIIKDFCDMEE